MDRPQKPSSAGPMNEHIAGFAMAFAVWGEFVDEIVGVTRRARIGYRGSLAVRVTDFVGGDQRVNADIIRRVVAGGRGPVWAVSWSSS